MKKLILFSTIFLLNSIFAQEYRSFNLLAPEYRKNLQDLTLAIDNIEEVKKRIKLQEKLVQKAPPPSEKIRVPAEGNLASVNLYLYKPKNGKADYKKPVIFFIHGGGYLFGSPLTNAKTLFSWANQHNALVVALEYRLLQTHQASLDDAYQGLKYVYQNAEKLGIDKEKIVLFGESSGGGLAARLAIYARDKGEIKPKAQVLIYPMLDYRTGGENSIYQNPYSGEFVWHPKSNQYAWKILQGDEKIEEMKNPAYFSPSLADNLSSLPETFILVGSLDLFVDESKDYAQKLIASGVETELHIISGVYHCYQYYYPKTPQAKEYRTLIRKTLNRLLK